MENKRVRSVFFGRRGHEGGGGKARSKVTEGVEKKKEVTESEEGYSPPRTLEPIFPKPPPPLWLVGWGEEEPKTGK